MNLKGRRWLAVALLLVGCDQIPGTNANDIAVGEREAAGVLRDPSSAQFRNETIAKLEIDGKKHVALCGEINGKNTYGAYVGFKRFVTVADDKQTLIDPQTGLTEKDHANAMASCKNAQRDLKNGLTIAEAVKFECEKSKDVVTDWYEQVQFDIAYKSICLKTPSKG